jgi:adenine-specific DNA-methyltransferase
MAKRTTTTTTTPAAEPGVESYRHKLAKRKNIPTAELQKLVPDDDKAIRKLRWPRNPDLDPQLVWRGKDVEPDPLEVDAPPIYIQEKIQPQAIIEDLRRQTRERRADEAPQFDFFHDFNGLPDPEAKTEFYAHDQNWSNRMILGDSLLVMASLAEREGLRGKVQCIFMDPPYGIKFNSNWQPSSKSRKVDDGKAESVSREPEVIRAFRDTWKDGIHTYISYLRDRLSICRNLLSPSGSIFIQIGDENVHLIRVLLDEVFSPECFVSEILVKKKGAQKSSLIDPVNDFILWYSRSPRTDSAVYFRSLYERREIDADTISEFSRIELPDGQCAATRAALTPDGSEVDYRLAPGALFRDYPDARLFRPWPITNGGSRENQNDPIKMDGTLVPPPKGRCWSHTSRSTNGSFSGMDRVHAAQRLLRTKQSIDFKRYLDDFPYKLISNWWDGLGGAADQIYVVQTNERIVERCILMTTQPGDLVLDPTCGSGTTAYVAEQWARRWITIDTSRVALTLARGRLMGARYDYYLLCDSEEGASKEAELTAKMQLDGLYTNNIRHGFVYERASRVTSSMIANNAEIDVIWDRWQKTLETLREKLNKALKQAWEEWQVPREAGVKWSEAAKIIHTQWWEARRARQKEIDESIARNADVEYLYDRPYKAKGVVRVAGPFTVESLSPHRVLPLGEDPYLAEILEANEDGDGAAKPRLKSPDGHAEPASAVETDFAQVVYDNLKAAGVQNTKKGETLKFEWLKPFPSRSGLIQFEGRYLEKGEPRRAAICIGPEYDTVGYDLVRRAAREAADLFDMLIICGFAFAPEVDETRLNFGRLTVLKARMNQDLRMADKLKATGAGNLFVVFGEPDIVIHERENDMLQVEIRGMDIFDPTTGEVRSSGGKELMNDVAAWFIDHDYDEESFFVRQAYFVGDDPYDALKRALKAEIDETAWAELNATISRPFARPKHGRICVKVINHFGDEVQKVFLV